MNKLFVPLTLAILILCSSLAQAADKVVVVPLGGTHVYIDPANIASAYYDWPDKAESTPHSAVIFLTVPADKHFVLTDIVGLAVVEILENDTPKMRVQVGGFTQSGDYSTYPNPITISSGVVFGPGTEVRVISYSYYAVSSTFRHGHVTLSGYYY